MKLKLTVGEILTMNAALGDLFQTVMAGGLAFDIAMNADKLSSAVKIFEENRNKMIEEYNKVKDDEKNPALLQEDVNKILEKEKEIELVMIKKEALLKLDLKPATFLGLNKIISDDEKP